MLKFQKWLVAAIVFMAVWLALYNFVSSSMNDSRILQVIQVLPMYAIVTFGAYSLAVIAINVISIEDCVEAAKELDLQVKEAKLDLQKKGMKL